MVVGAHRQQQNSWPSTLEFPRLCFLLRLHVTQEKCCHSQRTLGRHRLISPDRTLQRHANRTIPLPHPSFSQWPAIVSQQITVTPFKYTYCAHTFEAMLLLVILEHTIAQRKQSYTVMVHMPLCFTNVDI